MRKGRVLVVEEDADIAKMLRLYFDSQAYEVLVTDSCDEASRICDTRIVNVVLLAAQMLGANDFLDGLRGSVRTKYIAVICLVPEGKQAVGHLRLGFPDDYIAKPFDVGELRQRVETANQRRSREGLIHPITGLPAGPLINERLSQIEGSEEAWVAIWFRLGGEANFNIGEVMLFLADIIWETVGTLSVPGDFIGQSPELGNEFVIITSPDMAPQIYQTVMRKFHGEMWGEIELFCERWYL
jgi:CheY-like chemotaxis protein